MSFEAFLFMLVIAGVLVCWGVAAWLEWNRSDEDPDKDFYDDNHM